MGDHASDEDLARQLPLPLAQLRRRALNAKTALERHQTAYYLWEAALKLLSSTAVAAFAERGLREPELAERLKNLARPALGHWWELARKLLPVLAEGGDGSLLAARELVLGRARDDLPRAAGLDAVLRDALGEGSGARSTVRVSELFERLVRYRNRELGHGAAGQRGRDFYERVGQALLAGVSELLGRLDVLLGRKLIYVGEVRRQPTARWLVERYELLGESARRLESLEFSEPEASSRVLPERVYLEDRAAGAVGMTLRTLHPLALYEPEAGEFFFLSERRGTGRARYLSYTSGRTLEPREPRAEEGEPPRAPLWRPAGGRAGGGMGRDEPGRGRRRNRLRAGFAAEDDRRVRAPGEDRSRRHGDRLPGVAAELGEAGCPEVPPRRSRRPESRGAVRARDPLAW